MRCPARLARLLLLLTLVSAREGLAQDLPAEIQKTMQMFSTRDLEQRNVARAELQKLLASYDPGKRKSATSALVAQSLSRDQSKAIAAALALSQLAPPWEANNHERTTEGLYDDRLVVEKNLSFRRQLDDALANAKGLYLDAIDDYNNDRVTNVDAVAGKFDRMSTRFSKSRYAPRAAFYLGQYWARAAQLVPASKEDFLNRSNAAFDSYVRRAANSEFVSSEFDADALFYRALNGVLLGQEPDTVSRLKRLTSKLPQDQTIYVYRLFHHSGGPAESVVDRFVPARALVEAVVDFIQANPGKLPAAQAELAGRLRELR
jgi:hypothetical protein